MKYYKIKVGYSKDEFVSIDETELEMAQYIFMTDGKGMFNNGVVRGKDIIAIQEDWHKALEINPEWKLDADDHNEMAKQGITKEYRGSLAEVKNRVQYLIENKQEHLIGKNVEIPQLKSGVKQIDTKSVADKMKI